MQNLSKHPTIKIVSSNPQQTFQRLLSTFYSLTLNICMAQVLNSKLLWPYTALQKRFKDFWSVLQFTAISRPALKSRRAQ